MSEDARFEDGGERPLRLRALDVDDLTIISGLVQDAILPVGEIRWDRRHRRFAMLLNRFRWEDVEAAKKANRDVERVRSVLAVEDVLKVQAQGVDPRDKDTVLSVLALAFEPGEDGTGMILVTLAGDGDLRLEVETLEVLLRDVTRPYRAPSRHVPTHE
ncbi:hypothetical protein OG2516_17376 [Oceanicola granulosus HTCC2516]|uniref:DUF2948 family protein n=1 Tax=Oceanicola granulosus (strain ATCC BAA-861 / DSM 15982 / KCTC 12143 / HTCC2516) TaxID=314256 RepID=Q2CFG8_OCEGH|nr:DUF2948 family protein [Oceanicola granulosus]EAR51514.1 hypothetical protein OG2516_17376 [Oceanicola granulosus HTCC2516]